jgi:hypothetical protein
MWSRPPARQRATGADCEELEGQSSGTDWGWGVAIRRRAARLVATLHLLRLGQPLTHPKHDHPPRWNVNQQLRRCVSVEAPDPAAKLELLSEIAQEHQVEWDADLARREMLPGGDQGGGGGAGGSSGGGGGGGGGGYGGVVAAGAAGGGAAPYLTAQHAAAAASAAAASAQVAAEYARRLADATPGGPAPGYAGGYGGPPPGHAPGYGGHPAGAVRPGCPQPPIPGEGHYRPLGLAPVGGAPPVNPGTSNPAGFKIPSQEEIQRAYDSAQGPPAKDYYAEPPAGGAGAHAAPGPAAPQQPPAAGDGGDLGLPSAPGAGGSGLPKAESEFEELQRRLDALKRQP